MAKTVFRPGEAKNIEEKVMLPLYKDYSPIEDVEVEEEEEYTGPTAEDLRREAEEYKVQFEKEKQQLKADAQKEAERIIKADAENEAAAIIEKAKAEAAQIVAEAQSQHDKIVSEARNDGFEQGHQEGYEKGAAEVDRLIERMHKILEAVMQRREEILQDTESQIVELVILMARKVIKILSENQKNVIMANTVAALRKVKTRGNVTLRVNIEDVKLTTAHADEFIQHVENVQGITVQEDSSVEKGGCIVETDFGAIDARISSQLTELENKILEVSPVKNIKRQDPLTSAE